CYSLAPHSPAPPDIRSFPTRRSSDLFLGRQIRRVVFTDAMLMTDSAPIVHDQTGRAVLELLPPLQGFRVGLAGSEHVGGVDRAALGVKVRQMGKHMHGLPQGGKRGAEIGFN